MAVDATTDCIVCAARMGGGALPWHRVCSACRYESSTLADAINQAAVHAQVDEADRALALEGIRKDNFRLIVEAARRFARPGARTLLDVGCAHGWFLEQAQPHFAVLGLEPDRHIGQQAAQRGLAVREGYFPQALHAHEQFDVIVFNDVIEHIPDIRGALDACYRRLHAGGILILNLPNSAGLFYRLAQGLARVGWTGPFARMWQYGMPSPHVHYFQADNLARLVAPRGFVLRHARTIPAVQHRGLLARLRFVGKVHPLRLYATYAALCCLLPFVRLFPSDIMVAIFEKQPAAA